ncbi:MAG TPA: VWA domain-containing protein [Actinomycetota bacterium]|nr:VWA domain-containing protein [Actinomycetota bacterium]
MRLRRFAGAGAIAFACALLVVPLTASAQTTPSSLTTQIREVSFDTKGNTNVVVAVAGSALASTTKLTTSDFSVTENGKPVSGLTVQPLSTTGTAVALVLAMDVSSSMTPKLAAAKAAAVTFVGSLPANVRVAVIAFGSTVNVVQDFTTDHGALTNGINALAINGRTALFDAVVKAGDLLSKQLNTQHNVVVFTDGYEGDNNSTATIDQAISALKTNSAAATTVLLGTQTGHGIAVLAQLVGAVKGGQSIQASDTTKLNAAFAAAAQSLTSQYVLSYAATDTTTKDLNIAVSASVGGFQSTDSSVVLNGRSQVVPAGPGALKPAKPFFSPFANKTGLYVGIAAAGIGLLLFFGMLFYAPAGAVEERALQRRLRLYTKGGERKKQKEPGSSLLAGTALGRGAVSLVERAQSKSMDEKMQVDLDKAGWPLRSSEFILLQIGGFIAGVLIGWALLQRLWLGIVLGIVGVVVPKLLLSARINRRTSQFLSQLPDTLQLLAGSLQAGYGFLQALDTVAKEASPPTSIEFARVLSEARLGRPIEEALDSMAERVGGEDFKWVVLAINIQRQVGGNLAQLLTTVANTLREREQVRRQIKVLSAEGRLSAYILVALPFVLFGYLNIINKDYIHQLTGETVGKIAMLGALILIGIGAVWMRKIVNIDV